MIKMSGGTRIDLANSVKESFGVDIHVLLRNHPK
jgi:hypothetical protein